MTSLPQPESGDTRSQEEKDADSARIADTNVEGIGSQENRDLRKKAAETEKAWAGAGEEIGLQIWRIEKFEVKDWPKKRYGEFYSGDSYIVLQTKEDPESKAKSYNVYFWLGKDTSQDEMGTAAYKTVELDDLLGDEPVQYREVQGNESRQFTDMFDKITTLSGGVKSGFNIVEPEKYNPRLLQLAGYHQKVQVFQVPLKAASLNSVDSFVLDNGLTIYQFNGGKANAWEKRKANDTVNTLKNDRMGKVEHTYTIDGLADSQDEAGAFWEMLGGKPDEISDVPLDVKASENVAKEAKFMMLQVDADSDELKVTTVSDGSLDATKLDSNDAFIIDTGLSLYVWIGKGANKKEKREAMVHATKYLSDNGRDPKAVPICRVSEGKEPPHFHQIMEKGKGGKWTADMMKDGSGFCGRKNASNVTRDQRSLA